MNEIPLKQVIEASLANLKQVIDVDNVIGNPINLPEGGVVIPVSKVTLGFTSAGADYDGKRNPSRETPHFGGGTGAGMTILPLAFLVIQGSDVRLLSLDQPVADGVVGTINELIDKAPALIQKLKSFFAEKKAEKEANAQKKEADEATEL